MQRFRYVFLRRIRALDSATDNVLSGLFDWMAAVTGDCLPHMQAKVRELAGLGPVRAPGGTVWPDYLAP